MQPSTNNNHLGWTGRSRSGTWAFAETLLIFLLFAVYAGSPPPAANEAHYLAKAKHYWNPQWCPDDHFLESGNTHLVFFWSCGWMTRWLSLPTTAWVLRIIHWMALACAWRWLSVAMVPRPLATVLSAGLLLVGLTYGPMMGEWVIGGIEGKSIAYVFVVVAMGMLVRERWNGAWICLGAASMFHVLVGGWSAVALGFVWLAAGRRRPSILSILPGIATGGILSLAGLLPAIAMNRGVPADVVAEAHSIYVFRRLPHHLVFHQRPWEFVASHILLIATWCGLTMASWKTEASNRLQMFVAAAVAIALTGVAIDLGTLGRPDWSTTLLRFYWFRLSDAVVPMGTALAAILVLGELAVRRPRSALPVALGAAILIVFTLVDVWYPRWMDPRPLAVAQAHPTGASLPRDVQRRYHEWLAVCAWIERSTRPADRFLTPARQQTFKWYASRSEVATWKDSPQDALNLVEWWERFNRIDRLHVEGQSSHSSHWFTELARKYDCQYILIDRSRDEPLLPDTLLVYPLAPEANASFRVYAVPVEGR